MRASCCQKNTKHSSKSPACLPLCWKKLHSVSGQEATIQHSSTGILCLPEDNKMYIHVNSQAHVCVYNYTQKIRKTNRQTKINSCKVKQFDDFKS